MWNDIKSQAEPVIQALADIYQWLLDITGKSWTTSVSVSDRTMRSNGLDPDLIRNSTVPAQASGGTTIRSGATLVGENGPEIVNMPQGATVVPLTGDKAAAAGGSITQNNYFTQMELTPYEVQAEVQRLSRSLAGAF